MGEVGAFRAAGARPGIQRNSREEVPQLAQRSDGARRHPVQKMRLDQVPVVVDRVPPQPTVGEQIRRKFCGTMETPRGRQGGKQPPVAVPREVEAPDGREGRPRVPLGADAQKLSKSLIVLYRVCMGAEQFTSVFRRILGN